jgi:small subunit ribosomal protein S16
MVVIRLARFGRKKDPQYRITVADSRRWLCGKYIEILGHYNPKPGGKAVELNMDMEKLNEWMKKGAIPSERVQHLIKKAKGTATAKA